MKKINKEILKYEKKKDKKTRVNFINRGSSLKSTVY